MNTAFLLLGAIKINIGIKKEIPRLRGDDKMGAGMTE